jgi:acetoin utilization deacetylase AcuC-like enzyme
MQTAYSSHPDCLKHDMGPDHPQSPARLSAIKDQLIASSLLNYLQQHDAPLATFRSKRRALHTDCARFVLKILTNN